MPNAALAPAVILQPAGERRNLCIGATRTALGDTGAGWLLPAG